MTYRNTRPLTATQLRRVKADLEAFKDATKQFDKSVGKDLNFYNDICDELTAMRETMDKFKSNANASKLLSQSWQDMKLSTPPGDVGRQKSKYALDRLNPGFYSNVVTTTEDLIKAVDKFIALFDIEGGYTVIADN